MNTATVASALLALKREREAAGRVLDREQPELARAIDAVLNAWKAGSR